MFGLNGKYIFSFIKKEYAQNVGVHKLGQLFYLNNTDA